MTSYEIVKRTLEGKNPERAPRHLWLLPWAQNNYPKELKEIQENHPDDFVYIPATLHELPKLVKGDPYAKGQFRDDWGCVFTNIHEGIIGEIKKPLVQDDDLEDVDNIHIPEEWLSFDIEEVNENCKKYGGDKYKLAGSCPRPFERLQFLRGSENLYCDIIFRPEKMMEFIEKMHDFYCRLLTKWAKTDVDALTIMDDWGSQKTLLIDPKTWREIFKPMYQDYINIAHSHGKKIFMHSDGYILDILPDLCEMGLDAINSQLFCMGIDKLAPFKGKITFWGEMDRQYQLVSGTPETVAECVKQVYDTLWDNGKCIAQCEFGPGAKPENVESVFSTWEKLTRTK